MGVGALGVINRGVTSEIAPNAGDHLECDECGACIDICPVGALTSGIYRYQTRPWEMEHVGTVCTHCSDGCKTTLGVRQDEIIRGNNRDRSNEVCLSASTCQQEHYRNPRQGAQPRSPGKAGHQRE